MGCLTGWPGAAGELGVDFEELTVEEDIVIAPLPEEGGMTCFGAGVGAGLGLEGRGVLVVVVVEDVDGSGC